MNGIRATRALVIAVCALAVSACAKKKEKAQPAETTGAALNQPPEAVPLTQAARNEAKDIFASRCATCHGAGGEGNGPVSQRSKRLAVRNDEIIGRREIALGMRGDAIRLWEVESSVVAGNVVKDSRDVVVWYSLRNRVEDNVVEGCRYGTHLMFSRDAVVAKNRYVRDEVGVFVMYSRGVTVEENLVADAYGPAGTGIGLKEAGNVVARRNRVVHDGVGLYVDTSPLEPGDFDVVEDNWFRLNQVAIVFHASPRATKIAGNSLRDNASQVRVDGEGDALGVEWSGNDWDDYRGYDFDRDGTGDVPYELRSLSSDLTSRHPELAFFEGSPTLALVEAAGRVVPLFEPRTLVRDPRPRVRPMPMEALDAN
jgi:nitrous oxidase accessory protein